MGANRSQAVSVAAFLLGFTFLAGALYSGRAVFYLLSVGLLAVSVGVFLKCKPLEYSEN